MLFKNATEKNHSNTAIINGPPEHGIEAGKIILQIKSFLY